MRFEPRYNGCTRWGIVYRLYFTLVNLCVDILYAYIDPRISPNMIRGGEEFMLLTSKRK